MTTPDLPHLKALAESLYLTLDREEGHTSWGTCPQLRKQYWFDAAHDVARLLRDRDAVLVPRAELEEAADMLDEARWYEIDSNSREHIEMAAKLRQRSRG